MDWVYIVKQDEKYLHTARGYAADEAKSKAVVWCDKKAAEFPDAAVSDPRLQFPKSA
jgi:hypothetical protein